jgi:hypothetical protein
MTVPHYQVRILATVCCVIGASAGAPDGFATWVLLTLAACWSVVTLWAGHADRSPVLARARRPIEVTR